MEGKNESKHTPGKWMIRISHGKLYVVVAIGREAGHNNYHAVATIHDLHVENAELIASAPTLKAELSEMKKEREELIGVLNNLVEANPGDSTWNYPAAFDAAISLLNRINKTTNG